MNHTALLLIDIQKDYFPGGRFALPEIENAAQKAGQVLRHFRKQAQPVFHIWHAELDKEAPFLAAGTDGIEIYPPLKPRAAEPLIEKHYPNSFRETNLLELLKAAAVQSLVICGAMSNMCIDATVRAAFDCGFNCIVIEDACAASDIEFNGQLIKASQVHAAFMGALASAYAEVTTAQKFLKSERP